MSDGGTGERGSSLAGPGGVRGASLSGSEIEALYSDVSLIHRGRWGLFWGGAFTMLLGREEGEEGVCAVKD